MKKLNKTRLIVFILTLFLLFILSMNLSYPIFYSQEVELYSDIFGVDKFLVYSVIKAESNFDKNARSGKDAIGLMQVIESTSVEIFDKLNVSEENRNLYNPEVNIMAGTYYLSKLLELYNNDLEKVIAAYNSGMGNVNSWTDGEEESFRDNIKFDETSKYLKKVEKNYKVYKILYEDLNLEWTSLPNIFINIRLFLRDIFRTFRRLVDRFV